MKDRLGQRSPVLILLEVDVLEAAESAGLQVAPAVDQAEVELALLAARIVHVLALGLHGVRAVAAERREELAAPAEGEVAGAPPAEGGADVHAQQGEFLVAPLGFIDRALGFVVGDRFGLLLGERLGQAVDLILAERSADCADPPVRREACRSRPGDS